MCGGLGSREECVEVGLKGGMSGSWVEGRAVWPEGCTKNHKSSFFSI